MPVTTPTKPASTALVTSTALVNKAPEAINTTNRVEVVPKAIASEENPAEQNLAPIEQRKVEQKKAEQKKTEAEPTRMMVQPANQWRHSCSKPHRI